VKKDGIRLTHPSKLGAGVRREQRGIAEKRKAKKRLNTEVAEEPQR
jgi:hypothetical protein